MPLLSSHATSPKFPRFFWLISLGLLLITTLPYVWAAQVWQDQNLFGGFLFNPLDGNTYLAKMRQGWEGSWQFHLPYTAEPGEGAYLFLYYLFLGHLARISHLNLVFTFHLARLGGTLLMLLSLWRFFSVALQDLRLVKIAFAMAVFGSGMGWLASLTGQFTADLWVAEAYPFLSAYANPHFPFALAMLLWVLTPFDDFSPAPGVISRGLLTGLVGVALGVVLPFGVVVAGMTLVGLSFWKFIEGERDLKSTHVLRLVWFLIGASPILIYDFWAITTNPSLRAWNSQNLTPSPSPQDFVISFLPVILLGIPGIISILRSNQEKHRVLLVWCVAGVALLYLPIGLQRRLLLGLIVPFAGLSSLGIQFISRGRWHSQRRWVILFFVLVIPTNLVVLMAGLHGVQTRSSLIYLTRAEYQGFEWLVDHTPEKSKVLAAPESGLFIPAYSGRRVIYGHPFESIQATEMENLVVRLFNGTANLKDMETLDNIDYIFLGQRESKLGKPEFLEDYEVVFQEGEVTIFGKIR